MNKLILALLFLSCNAWADYYDWQLIGKTPNSHTSLKTMVDKDGNKIITDGGNWEDNARNYRAPVNYERTPANHTSSPSGSSQQSQNLVGQAVQAFKRGTFGDIVYGKMLLRAAQVQNGTYNQYQNISNQDQTNHPSEYQYQNIRNQDQTNPPSEYKYESYSGQKYKYDLTNPSDAIQYSVDPAAQVLDSVKPMVDIDRSIGQQGGWAE